MRKIIAAAAVAAGITIGLAAPIGAAPPVSNNPNALVFPIQCDGFNGGEPFFIWAPNVKGFFTGNAGLVGHPLGGVDVPVGVQKVPSQGAAFDRAVPCTAPDGTVYVMPTGKPA